MAQSNSIDMLNRRKFLSVCAASTASLALPGCAKDELIVKNKIMKTNIPKNALVLYYSQTGHTQRYGKLIARTLEKRGLAVRANDIREFDRAAIGAYDIIFMGVPVHYLDVPGNVISWLESLSSIDGIPVAAYSTFGGPGDNQFNTAFHVLRYLTAKGGVPAGIASFGNMSTFAPTWSLGYEKRILKYRDKPDKETYAKVRQFASDVLGSVAAGTTSVVKKEFNFSELIRGAFLVKAYKLLIHRHGINEKKCIDCGTCVEKCPTSSISLERHAIETGTCIACMGCVNNCPVRAIDMRITGKRVYGFNDFLKRNKIVIMEPEL